MPEVKQQDPWVRYPEREARVKAAREAERFNIIHMAATIASGMMGSFASEHNPDPQRYADTAVTIAAAIIRRVDSGVQALIEKDASDRAD